METLSKEEEARYGELQEMALDFARHGECDILESMLKSGLHVNVSDAKGNTLLMLAAYNGERDTVRMLLSYGALVDQRNDRYQTPLGGAAFKGYLEICKALVEAGAEVDSDNGGGRTPIMFAALFGRVGVVEYLQSVGGKGKEKKIIGFSPRSVAKAVLYVKMLFTGKPKRSLVA
ncbi:ankyrin repeat domain-containing protein [Sulfurospirillum barnesii]|uniref:Ankyrin repeat-containing protein n=1 Tax=Sulfurospirillum barnesii (strain ATCC 700032 / DSM 10660 / SES-3) TaxID=760154 RepID=I3Y0R3_SULBS|nr:ankyrin repeat domain-containing protein [Sulfurospirillum barnesii]AFL69787.1 ankyrin repeat-containing protein [Sulfurospirillum barnesii SES-3]